MAAPSTATAEAVEGGVRVAGKAAYAGGSALARCTRSCCDAFGGCIKKLHPETVATMLRVINIANAVLLGFACFYAYSLVGPTDVTRAFLATYIGIFGTLLLLFETRVKYTSGWIRRNFGFLFTYSGRTVFLVFLGAVCFGMLDDSQKTLAGYTWCLCVGLATIVNSLFNCFIICNHPGFQEMNKNDAHAAPAGTDPSKMTDDQIRAYLEAHPEIAARVATDAGEAVASDQVVVGVAPEAEDWASGAGKKAAPQSSGGGFFGGFGFGRKKDIPVASPASGLEGASGTSAAYVPPSIPVAEPDGVASTYSAAASMPSYVPPSAGAGGSSAAGAASGSGAAFAIEGEDDNPFAAAGGANPYAGR